MATGAYGPWAMIHDLDESLRALVQRDVLNGTKVDVSFEAPTREWAAKRQGPALSMYLYDLHEDLQRRPGQFEENRGGNGRVTDRTKPPPRFKLSYLITAWTQRPEDEHRLLSSMLSCFLSYDGLPKEVLQGSLAEQDEVIRTTIGLPLPPERSLSDVWTALGGELKPSLDLVIVAPFPPLTPREQPVGPPVAQRRVRVRATKGPLRGLVEEMGPRSEPGEAAGP